jgi:alkylated DNA nucleotide flippase Atl1
MAPRARDVGAVLRLQKADQDHPAHRAVSVARAIVEATLYNVDGRRGHRI